MEYVLVGSKEKLLAFAVVCKRRVEVQEVWEKQRSETINDLLYDDRSKNVFIVSWQYGITSIKLF